MTEGTGYGLITAEMTTPTVYVTIRGDNAKFRCKTDVRYEGGGKIDPNPHPDWRRFVIYDVRAHFHKLGLPECRIVVLEEMMGGLQSAKSATA